ncbi:MAG TPA: sigma-70 family RNA polymerase sigma factor [Gemmataceae bacterium]|nr:sigma-70 family RNA polymerase sigma factor [Gemmataceae bacterium]
MTESPDAVPPDWEGDRGYLLILARLRVPPWLRAKVDASDVVQQALLQAHARRDQLRAGDAAGRRAWLGRILAHAIADAVRRFVGAGRAAGLERSLQDGFADSSARLEAVIAADQSSPSSRADRLDELARLAAAIDSLPDDQWVAVELMHLHGWSVDQIARQTGKTHEAVGGLLRRGMRALRDRLNPGDRDAR